MSGHTKPIIQSLERIGSVFLNRIPDAAARDLADLVGYLSSTRAPDSALGVGVRGVVLDGLHVAAQVVPDMSVAIAVGMAFAPAAGTTGVVGTPQTNLDSNFVMLAKRTATAAQAIASSAGLVTGRTDLVELVPGLTPDEQKIVDLWDATTKKFLPSGAAVTTLQHGEGTIVVTTGADGYVTPAPTAGRIPIAAVIVPPGTLAIPQEAVFDLRITLDDVRAAKGEALTSIDSSQVDLDVALPLSTTTAQNVTMAVQARVRGLRAGAMTAGALDSRPAAVSYANALTLDRNTWANIVGGSGPAYLYLYAVASDDQGYRFSHGPYGAAMTGAVGYSHTGWLIWSHVPPSLTNGSLAPSATLHLPQGVGNGTVTPGGASARAVCVGAAKFNAANKCFDKGLRLRNGAGEWQSNVAPLITTAAAPTYLAEGTATTTTSGFGGDWNPADLPVGPLSIDIGILVAVPNPTAPGAERFFDLFEKKDGSANYGKVIAHAGGVVPSLPSASEFVMFGRGLPVGQFANTRGTTKTGFFLLCTCRYGSALTGSGINDPSILAYTPTINLTGYQWPHGAVAA